MSGGLLDAWPPLSPASYLRRPAAELPFPLAEPDSTLFSRGRHALYHGLRALGLGAGDEVLMPAYHHGSEVEAALRAGLRCRFYEATESLEPDGEELESLLGPKVRALHVTHFLGFPQDAQRWRRWCSERGLLLVEDAAQAWLGRHADGRPLGADGDVAIFCLYKTFGLPDGAALRLPAVGVAEPSPNGIGARELTRRHADWLASRAGWAARLRSSLRRESPYVPSADFAFGDPRGGPSRATLFLLPRVAEPEATAARRRNYAFLLESLRRWVPSPFAELSPGAVPFVFPVESDGKAEVLAQLRRERIAALDFWSVPHQALAGEPFPAAARRRERTVGLPVHQELRPADVERIAAVAAQALSGRTSNLNQ